MKNNRNWYWFVLALFPFAVPLAFLLGAHGSIGFNTALSAVSDTMSLFRVEVFADLYETVFEAIEWGFPAVCIDYMSFLTCVVFARLIYELFVFLPKFCISIFERKK